MPYAINQEVVYVGPDVRLMAAAMGATAPTPGRVYTIRAVNCLPSPRDGEMLLCYVFHEYANPMTNHLGILCESLHVEHKWLKPVEKRTTSIEIFKALLNPANHKNLEGV